MAGQIKNYRRFYAAFNRLPHYGNDEEQKEGFVSTYTKGRTTHLSEMKSREYTDMCKALENMCGYGDQRKRHRSIALHLMQEVGVDTKDWQHINDFCRHPRICGKEFAQLGIPELEALQLKLRAIKRKGGLRSEERRVKSEETAFAGRSERQFSCSSDNIHQSQIILVNYGTEQSIKPS